MKRRTICTIFLTLILAACTATTGAVSPTPTGGAMPPTAASIENTEQPTAAPVVTETEAVPRPTSTAVQETPQPVVSPSPAAASAPADGDIEWVTPAARAPRLQQDIFYSAAAQAQVSYHIYIPDAYNSQPERRFPVLYWLHGSGGGLSGIPWLVNYFNSAIEAGKMPPVLIVFANGLVNSMWADSHDGRVPMETVVIHELIPQIDAAYRTIASRQGRVIEGFSMGGYGAARLGFKYPELFSAVSMLGAGPLQQVFDVNTAPRSKTGDAQVVFDAVYGSSQEYYRLQSPWYWAEQNAATLQSRMPIRQVIGGRDETLQNNRLFDAHLTELAIPHTFTILPGVPHDPRRVLEALGENAWEFYRAIWGQE